MATLIYRILVQLDLWQIVPEDIIALDRQLQTLAGLEACGRRPNLNIDRDYFTWPQRQLSLVTQPRPFESA